MSSSIFSGNLKSIREFSVSSRGSCFTTTVSKLISFNCTGPLFRRLRLLPSVLLSCLLTDFLLERVFCTLEKSLLPWSDIADPELLRDFEVLLSLLLLERLFLPPVFGVSGP